MPAIGIDLGTTNSCVAVFRKGQVEIIPNEQGDRLTPSCVSFTSEERLIGDAAKQEAPINFENTLIQIKRLIGRTYDDPVVQEDMKLWGFVILNDGNKPKIPVVQCYERKVYYPEQISAMVLEEMKKTAENYLGEEITDAVITVPAYFNDAQRRATKDAGKIAGLNVIGMINEPTAAAVAYGLDRMNESERNVLIFDLGGGTFDVTVVKIQESIFEVQATGGDTHLGGEDFDNRMVDHFVEEFKRQHDVDVSVDRRALNRLRVQCEAAKRKLSVSTQAKVQIDSLHEGIDFRSSMSRARFETLNQDLFTKTIETVAQALEDAKMSKDEIEDIVLVGGSTRIPKIRELLENFFRGKDLCRTINPDEAVAYGAAAHAANLSNDESSLIKEFQLHDVAPLSLGVEVGGCDMSVIVRRNTNIPFKNTKNYTTSVDNQSSVLFKVFEGERAATKNNTLLDSFEIDGILPAPRGIPHFDVCFDIDANGILNVSGRDRATEKCQQIIISSDRGRLSKEEISRMVAEAERYRSEDALWKEQSEARNMLENYTYAIKHYIENPENCGDITVKEQSKVVDKCNEILGWIDNNKNTLKKSFESKKEELKSFCLPVLSKISGGTDLLESLEKKD
ncbi:heat shock cognate 71 kDa protein-like [Styela clava]